MTITRVVDAIMEATPGSEVEDYLYLDPKLGRSSTSKLPKARTTFQEAYVFVVGGGNYLEYQNLQEYANVIF